MRWGVMIAGALLCGLPMCLLNQAMSSEYDMISILQAPLAASAARGCLMWCQGVPQWHTDSNPGSVQGHGDMGGQS